MEDIGDPLGDRVMKNVPQIARFPLKKDEIWHISGKQSRQTIIHQPKSNTHQNRVINNSVEWII